MTWMYKEMLAMMNRVQSVMPSSQVGVVHETLEEPVQFIPSPACRLSPRIASIHQLDQGRHVRSPTRSNLDFFVKRSRTSNTPSSESLTEIISAVSSIVSRPQATCPRTNQIDRIHLDIPLDCLSGNCSSCQSSTPQGSGQQLPKNERSFIHSTFQAGLSVVWNPDQVVKWRSSRLEVPLDLSMLFPGVSRSWGVVARLGTPDVQLASRSGIE